MLSEVVSNKALSVSFQTSKVSAEVIVEVIEKLLQEKMKPKTNTKVKEKTGKQSLKELKKKGNIQVIDITDETLKRLSRYLKKYNIDYAILKDKSQENTYSLFFRNFDAEIVNNVMEKYIKGNYQEKESIINKINKIKQKHKETQKNKSVNKDNLQKGSEIEL